MGSLIFQLSPSGEMPSIQWCLSGPVAALNRRDGDQIGSLAEFGNCSRYGFLDATLFRIAEFYAMAFVQHPQDLSPAKPLLEVCDDPRT
jgi:hypothetical protein